MVVIIAVVAVLVVGGGVAAAIVVSSGGKSHNSQKSGGPTASAPTQGPSSGDFPTSGGGGPSSSGGGGSGAPSNSDSEAVVQRYISDINKQNKDDAETLICSQFRQEWKDSLNTAGNDFEFKITDATVSGVTGGDLPNSTKVTYDLKVVYRGSNKDATVPFTIIDENGAKICGES
jgi:hypothetical protein